MDFLLHLTILVAMYMFVPLGYNLVFGKGKVLHFGQIAQSIIAGYVLWAFVMQFDVPFIAALLVAAIATAAASLLLAWLSFRLEPDGLGVMSIALHLAVLAVVLNWQSVTRGALGIPRIPRWDFMASNTGFALTVAVFAVAWIAFIRFIDRSSIGRQLEALAEHEWHAESLGISRKRVHTIAFLISGLGSLLANTFFPMYLFLLSPTDYNFPVMIFVVMVIVAGGPGRLWSVALATGLLVLFREGLRFVNLPSDILGPMQLILFGFILFAAVWIRRDMLFPHQRRV